MDSVTQIALGAALGGLVAGKPLGRKAFLGGAILGTLPDLDVMIDYGSAVANYTQHRGFSHSLLVLLPVSLLLALSLQRWQPSLSFARCFAFTALPLLTHPLLDTFTTYGTQLFWPFGPPLALNSIFIIDPLYTLPLTVAIALAIWRPHKWTAKALASGLVVSSLYLGWSLFAQQQMTERVEPLLAEFNLQNAPRLVQPMPFNTVLWRVTVMGKDERLEIVTGFFDGNIPLTVERFPRRNDLERIAATFVEDQRLHWFAGDFLDYATTPEGLAVTDVRLGIPGFHPFTFILARQHSDQWNVVESYQYEVDQELPEGALNLLWRRAIGTEPVLCLATLTIPELTAAQARIAQSTPHSGEGLDADAGCGPDAG